MASPTDVPALEHARGARAILAPARRSAALTSGLAGEFQSPEALVGAVARLKELGYTRLDAYTPFPVHQLDASLTRRSRIPLIMLVGGLSGAAIGYGIQWWCNAVDFPINVGGRPLASVPAFIPITFESGVLFASVLGFLALMWFCRLPRLYDSVFEADGFERATLDGFWITVDAADPVFDAAIRDDLMQLGALRVEPFGGRP
jgi:hypothetical protein